MPVEFVDFEAARDAKGLRMVVVSGVPSPWGEAAKGILHVKGLPWQAVRLDPGSETMFAWTGSRSGPVLLYEDEPPRSGWAEILLCAERLAPTPRLIPGDPVDRALLFGLAHEICGEEGLGWTRRLQGVHSSLHGGPGFPAPVAQYLGDKYGYRADDAPGYDARVRALLRMLADRLKAQDATGSRNLLGDSLTAVDIYCATFMALFDPLPEAQCPMPQPLREAFSTVDDETAAALDPILLAHRDRVYETTLELPLSL